MTMASNYDIGIIGMEVYFPNYFVEQEELGKSSIISTK